LLRSERHIEEILLSRGKPLAGILRLKELRAADFVSKHDWDRACDETERELQRSAEFLGRTIRIYYPSESLAVAAIEDLGRRDV